MRRDTLVLAQPWMSGIATVVMLVTSTGHDLEVGCKVLVKQARFPSFPRLKGETASLAYRKCAWLRTMFREVRLLQGALACHRATRFVAETGVNEFTD